jgi:hypothetical protein
MAGALEKEENGVIVLIERSVETPRSPSIATRSLAVLTLRRLRDISTPGSPPTRLTAVPDKWIRPTRRPADLSVGPTDLVGRPHDLLKTFQKIPQTTYSITTLRLGVQDKTSVDFAQSRSTGYGKMCNVDLGLLVVTDKESGDRPHPLANIRRTRRPLVQSRNPQAINTDNRM